MSNALLFIPDISGFTEFVKQTEIQHSKHIIKELLELLIDSNEMNLQLAEIEGDALFFYKLDDHFPLVALINQVEEMYKSFHQHLLLYKHRRVCNCGACTNAEGLQLKFIVHEADIDFIEIKNTKKPFGKEVIKVHRLLKNKVPLNEYMLLSETFSKGHESELNIMLENKTKLIEDEYDFGHYSYEYLSLDYIQKDQLSDFKPSSPPLGRHLITKQITIHADANDIFQYILDLQNRLSLAPELDQLEYNKDEINQAGSKHICVIGDKRIEQTTQLAQADIGELTFVESTNDAPFVKNINSVYKFSPTEQGTLMTLDFYTRSTSLVSKVLSPLIKAVLGKSARKTLAILKEKMEDKNGKI